MHGPLLGHLLKQAQFVKSQMPPFSIFLCRSASPWYLRIHCTQRCTGNVQTWEWTLIQNACVPGRGGACSTEGSYEKTLNDNSYRLAEERCLGRAATAATLTTDFFSLQKGKEIHVCHDSHPVRDTLWQPWQAICNFAHLWRTGFQGAAIWHQQDTMYPWGLAY